MFGVSVKRNSEGYGSSIEVHDSVLYHQLGFWNDVPSSPLLLQLGEIWFYPNYIIEGTILDVELFLLSMRLCNSKHSFFCPKSHNLERSSFYFFYPFNRSRMTNEYDFNLDEHFLMSEKFFYELKKVAIAEEDFRNFLQIFDTSVDNEMRLFLAVTKMEYLLLKSDSELKFRFSLFSYYLLNKLGQQVCFEKMVEIYNKRSKIAHGEKIEIGKEELDLVLSYTSLVFLEARRNKNLTADILKEIKIKLK